MSVNVRRSRNEKGWEVDIIVRTPDGKKIRERIDAPVSSKTAAQRWGEQREHHLAIHGRSQSRKEAPTFSEFYPQYLSYSENNNKPSTTYAKKSIFSVVTRQAHGAAPRQAHGTGLRRERPLS